mmetsp:Transcript_22437/g.55622  ORF Transcript_22437/g.55622 Transcript_22437/m.55622 type:complete len:251 (-) Transcript_22437:958-1710(-)
MLSPSFEFHHFGREDLFRLIQSPMRERDWLSFKCISVMRTAIFAWRSLDFNSISDLAILNSETCPSHLLRNSVSRDLAGRALSRGFLFSALFFCSPNALLVVRALFSSCWSKSVKSLWSSAAGNPSIPDKFLTPSTSLHLLAAAKRYGTSRVRTCSRRVVKVWIKVLLPRESLLSSVGSPNAFFIICSLCERVPTSFSVELFMTLALSSKVAQVSSKQNSILFCAFSRSELSAPSSPQICCSCDIVFLAS